MHGFTCYRLDEHDGRRSLTRDGWDAFSPAGTIARLDRMQAQHEEADRLVSKYSVARGDRITPQGSTLTPMGDNVSRTLLEDEVWSVRAMRHVFRLKPALSFQAWVTVLNPVMHHGYPPQWALTLDGDLAGVVPKSTLVAPTPESKAAARHVKQPHPPQATNVR